MLLFLESLQYIHTSFDIANFFPLIAKPLI